MRAAWRSVVLGLPIAMAACGPAAGPVADPDGTTAAEDGTTASTGGVTTGPGLTAEDRGSEAGADSTLGSSATTVEDTGTTGPGLACEMNEPDDGCPSGCMESFAYPSGGTDLDVAGGRKLCVEIGDPLDAAYSSAWWAEIDGEVLFLLSHQSCLAHVSATPAGWAECTGAADEPELCSLLCAQNVCPGELDALELQTCDVPTPCSAVAFDGFCEPEPALECVVASLRDRVPGRYTIEFPWLNESWEWLLVVSDDGSVQTTLLDFSGLACPSAFTPGWHPAQRCQLAEPELFASCVGATDLCGDHSHCMPGQNPLAPWLVDCVQQPAACP